MVPPTVEKEEKYARQLQRLTAPLPRVATTYNKGGHFFNPFFVSFDAICDPPLPRVPAPPPRVTALPSMSLSASHEPELRLHMSLLHVLISTAPPTRFLRHLQGCLRHLQRCPVDHILSPFASASPSSHQSARVC